MMNNPTLEIDAALPDRYREASPHQLLQAVSLRPGDLILDVGCGKGYFTRALAARLGSSGRVLALDVNAAVIKHFKSQGLPAGCFLLLVTAVHFPLRSNSVDGAVLAFVLHESRQRQELLQEVLRVLKPGAWAMVVEWQWDPQRQTVQRWDRLPRQQTLQLLREAGFNEYAVTYQNDRFYQIITHKREVAS
ncbi:MAG: methyltransferase domain-containing protein [Calditrichaeota bacterium]|nr:methyltransferase domain-containing protein [Calditrichota bacterium]